MQHIVNSHQPKSNCAKVTYPKSVPTRPDKVSTPAIPTAPIPYRPAGNRTVSQGDRNHDQRRPQKMFDAALRGQTKSWQRFSSWSSWLRGQKEVQSCRFSSVLSAPFRAAKGSCSRRCSSPRPSVSSVDKCAAVAVLRFVEKGRPSGGSVPPVAALRRQKEVAVAVAVLRGPPCPPWTNVLPLQFFVVLRPSLRGKRFPPPRPSRTDQIMTLHISVQTNVSEPWLPRRYAAFHYPSPLPPTPCTL